MDKEIIYKIKAPDFERGLRNKHYKKFERHQFILEYAKVCQRKYELERMVGFFDKKNNIFKEEK